MEQFLYYSRTMEKITGYILILLGLVIVCVAGWNGLMVFTGKAEPIRIFISSQTPINTPQIPQSSEPSNEVLASLQPMLSSLVGQTMGPNMEKPINITIHFLILGFFVTIGFRVASIGAMLVRSITYKIKEVVSEQTIRQ